MWGRGSIFSKTIGSAELYTVISWELRKGCVLWLRFLFPPPLFSSSSCLRIQNVVLQRGYVLCYKRVFPFSLRGCARTCVCMRACVQDGCTLCIAGIAGTGCLCIWITHTHTGRGYGERAEQTSRTRAQGSPSQSMAWQRRVKACQGVLPCVGITSVRGGRV